MNGWLVLLWTVILIVLSAFFVGAEFSLMSSKRHRLEEAAQRSAAGKAALKNASELTMLLAGAQLGITLCTLGLGAITKPAVHDFLVPVFELLQLGPIVADGIAFVVALLLVTFLHLVVGEMAPKSWAIAHPEKSAVLLALPMRAFMFVTHPILRLLNNMANWMVRKAGSQPVDELTSGQNPESLRHLVEHSASVGALEASYVSTLSNALDLRNLTVGDVFVRKPLRGVGPDAGVAEIQTESVRDGHRRVLVRDGDVTVGLVHVRDTLARQATDLTAADLVRQPMILPTSTTVGEALLRMRESKTQLAVISEEGKEVGLLSSNDIMMRVLPQDSGQSAAPQTIAITKGAHPHPRA